MKRGMVRVLLIAIAIVVGLFLVSGLVLRSMVSGSAKDKLIASLSEKTGVPVTVRSADFDLGQWFRLHPAVALDTIAVENPPGFRSKYLFEAKKITAQVSLAALLHKTIAVHSFHISEPHIVIETNARGLSNVGALLQKLSANPGGAGNNTSLTVDDFSIDSGTLAIAGSQNVNIQAIDIRLSNFSTDRRCKVEASAKLFGDGSSTLKLDGAAGPFGADSLPLSATLNLNIGLADIPVALRREQFGNVLASPGSKAKAKLDATIQGDLYGTLTGPAKLALTDILIGKDSGHVLPFSGETTAALTSSGLMTSPRFELKVPNARLKLGQGEWTGSAELDSHGESNSGSIRGSIHNVDINQLLSSLTAASEKLYGSLAIPSFSLQFSGRNAAEIRSSLKGSGRLTVTQGKLAALNLLATIEQALNATTQATPATKGSTPFNTLSADLNIAQLRMNVANLVLDGPALRAEGSGVIGFDQSLSFNLTAHVNGGLANLYNKVSMHPASNTADVPLTIAGTVDSPQVRPSVKKIATDVVHGLIDSFLKKKVP
jgi:uncharacterized protein involved in outer membrane biogenesis